MNEEIEELFPAQNIENEIHGVNTEKVVSKEAAVIDTMSINYNEYISKLNSFYKETTMENSIISTFSVDDGICNHTVILRESTGTEEIKIEKTFEYDSNFINNFLVLMLEEYNKENVVFNSTIEILDEDKANFVARTKSNDSLIIVGVSIELANYFKDISTRSNIDISALSEETINEKGIGNYLVIILTIITIGISLIGMVVFSLIYYRS